MTDSLSPLFGPGSQPAEDDVVLDYLALPQGMTTYVMPPLPEKSQVQDIGAALARLDVVREALAHFKRGQPSYRVGLAGLDAANIAFVNEVLGEGEVSVVAGSDTQIQESVLAGVWRCRAVSPGGDVEDAIEIGHFPQAVQELAFAGCPSRIAAPQGEPADGLLAAPSLLAEVQQALTDGARSHAINLSLLPHTEEDLAFLARHLGEGTVHILSRGYGNCRISSTRTRNVWWVRFYNSQDTLILNSLEVCAIPPVAQAAIEDVHDSGERLAEILAVYR